MTIINNQKAWVNVLQFNINSLPEDTHPSLQYDYTVIYDSASDELRKVALSNMVAGNSGTPSRTISLTAHGFNKGDWLNNNGTFALAKGDTATNAEVIGVVSNVIDANTFSYVNGGALDLPGLTAGGRYYISDTVAGQMTLTEPTTTGHVSKPVFLADSTTGGMVLIERGKIL